MDNFEYSAKFGSEQEPFHVEVLAVVNKQLSYEDYTTLNEVFTTLGGLAFKYLEGGDAK